MSEIITTKTRQRIAVNKTGHPAAFRKIRCPKCRTGFGIQSNIDNKLYSCSRCGRQFMAGQLM